MPGRALAGWWFAWLVVAIVVVAPACKSREDPGATGTKVTAESDYDATEPIVDDNYRFRLTSPGTGWKLLRTVDMRQMMPDAVAGLVGPAGQFGGVIVEKAPGFTLEQAAGLISSSIPQAVLESERDLEFVGLPAHRSHYSAMIEGANYRYVHVIFLREGYLYQLMGWGLASSVEFADLEPVISSFALTEGEIRGPVDDRPPVTQADGPTWQIREGEFRSVVSGLVVEPTPGWRILVGRELAQINPEAELALTNAEQNAYFTVITEHYGVGDPAGLVAVIRANFEQAMGTSQVEATRRVAGHAVEFSAYHMSSLEFLVGIIVADGSITQVLTWYPEAAREPALVVIEQLMAGITELSGPEREALATQLRAREGVIRKVAPRSAFLADEFRDFAHAITWTQPRGLYEVHIGDELINKPNVVLQIAAPIEGVYAELAVFEGEADRAGEYHESFASGLSDRRDESGSITGVPVSKSFGISTLDDRQLSYALLTAAHHGHAIVLSVWSPVQAASPETLAAVSSGLGLPAALPETSVAGGRFLDHRFGMSVEEPSGWVRRDSSPSTFAQGRVTEWKQGSGELSVVSMSSGSFSDDEAWLASFMEQSLRDNLASKHALGKPETSVGSIAGRRSRRLVYPDAQIEIVVAGESLTMVVMVQVDDELAERFRGSIRWTDE